MDICGVGFGGGCGDTPIIIDTAGEGFSLTDFANGVLFDFYSSGHPIRMSWTAPGSKNAWLVLPNGGAVTGKQLFGNVTPQPPSKNPNGFLALSVYDYNHDGVIDIKDSVFMNLRLWLDANHNGIAEASELFTLPALGVDSISLNYTETKRTDEYGNSFRYRATVDDAKHVHVGRFAYDLFLLTK